MLVKAEIPSQVSPEETRKKREHVALGTTDGLKHLFSDIKFRSMQVSCPLFPDTTVAIADKTKARPMNISRSRDTFLR